MRLHISLDDDIVAEVDKVAGPRQRSAFIVAAVKRAIDDRGRARDILAALGSIGDSGHAWDEDPAAWVRAQRRADKRRIG